VKERVNLRITLMCFEGLLYPLLLTTLHVASENAIARRIWQSFYVFQGLNVRESVCHRL